MKRTNYMQWLMTSTRDNVAIEAIKGGFDGSWERLIARKLEHETKRGVSEAEVLMQAAGDNSLKAAYLVTNSKIKQLV